MEILKNTIRVERARHRLSQATLAVGAECSPQSIHSIETGKFTPSITLGFRIVRFLNTLKSESQKMAIEDLFKLENDK